ncbi:EamA/RhaT family transporter [Sungkyunkwania multivorans]|uniref:EamA/RhaT family transporter n=1 Tax=Sungkyunkwania multivorans TaxID=1173618 RepID=A0ABW3CWH5_9FLAO
MIYLALSILISSSLFVIFKLFEKFNLDTLHCIIVNYIVACICGYLNYHGNTKVAEIPEQPWFLGTIALGFLFISVFNVMALTSQRNGLSVASVAGKMSVVIPVIFGVWAYDEHLGFVKILGILLALMAVYLTSIKESASFTKGNLLLPVLLFLGSGVIDTSIKYLETNYVPSDGIPLFSATIFAFAAIIGLAIITFQIIKGNFRFIGKNILGGIALGIPNYYSIYYLLKALQTKGLESSTLFTINNVAIVMLTTLFGLFIFKERLIPRNWLGIVIAIISIIIVTLA